MPDLAGLNPAVALLELLNDVGEERCELAIDVVVNADGDEVLFDLCPSPELVAAYAPVKRVVGWAILAVAVLASVNAILAQLGAGSPGGGTSRAGKGGV
jgi:hypothetical protein